MSKPAYEEAYRSFDWSESLAALGWQPGEPVNIAHTIVDRHAADERIALHWFGKDGSRRDYSFGELSRLSNRVANLLRSLGVAKGDRVAGYLPRIPETIAFMLGTWKAGGIYVPVFTGFAADAIRFRIEHSGAKIFCTHWEYRHFLPDEMKGMVALITLAGPAGEGVSKGDLDLACELERQSERFDPVPCRPDEAAVLLYTSGSTGQPKGVKIANNFVRSIYPYMRFGLDLRMDDVFWPTGDPGWGYGLVCYMVPMALGMAVTSCEAAATPESCLALLQNHRVTNLATTPTLLRAIMALGEEAVGRYKARPRCVSSCGEPLNAEVVNFFRKCWQVTVMDHYGASEVGLPVGNPNALEMTVKPGSMGRAFPGFDAAVVDDEGRELGPGQVGHFGLRPGEASCYSLGYWQDAKRTAEASCGGWITLGDLARRDAEGYFWFEGRADDLINSAGYRIGPFEVESAILRHPDVAEAAVIGEADALRGQIVKAYVVLKPGHTPREGLADEIVAVVRSTLGKHQYPRQIVFTEHLPKTETGKIQRFRLRSHAAL